MKKLTVFLISIIAVSASAAGGHVYELGSGRKKLLFNIDRKLERKGDRGLFSIIHKTPDGKVVITEVAEFTKDKSLIKYNINYHRRNEQGEIKVVGDKIHFSYTKVGETKTSTEDLKNNFVVGPSINFYLHKNWDKLLAGKSVEVRFGVDYRRDTVGFSFKRLKDKEKNKNEMVLIMKPSSFIIAALVDPVLFTYNLKTKNILSFEGRAKPKKLVNGKWKDLDAETVYEGELQLLGSAK